jgi:2'-hydroxyisoflavone reductase
MTFDPARARFTAPLSGGLSRRDWLRAAALGAIAGAALPGIVHGAEDKASPKASPAGKTLLVLGGTSFLGPQVVDAAKARGYKVTLFNRGKTNPGMFPDLEQLHGDRNVSLAPLEGRTWDVVVDTSAYFPRQVRMSAGLLKSSSKAYVLVSSISVYADTSRPALDESSPVGKIPDETVETIGEGNYGPLKALCEQAAEKEMPGRVLNVRPALIVGPGDPTDRFTYWPVRVARGGEVVAPGDPADPVQFVDVRDLGEWIVRAAEAGTRGVFNATGPAAPLGIGGLLATCKKVGKSDATFRWADAAFLEAQKVEAWSDMPVWLPPAGETLGANRVSGARAMAAGLTFRPLETTVADTLAWWKTLPEERRAKPKAGLAPEREAAILAALKARSKPA